MEVKQSMKALDFETRTAVAKCVSEFCYERQIVTKISCYVFRESITRVCEAAGFKPPSKKPKRSKVSKLLGDEPSMKYAGANVNLTVTTETISIMVMDSGEVRKLVNVLHE